MTNLIKYELAEMINKLELYSNSAKIPHNDKELLAEALTNIKVVLENQ